MYAYEKKPTLEEVLAKGRRKEWRWILGVFAAAVLLSFFRGTDSIAINFENDILTVSGPQQFTQGIPLAELEALEIWEHMEPGTCQDGGENGSYRWGTWHSDTLGTYRLCIQKNIPCVLAATGSDGTLLVFNYADQSQTLQVFDLILGVLDSKGLPRPAVSRPPA